MKRIIERFRGREGSAELDRRWTRKVTDVRNWFVFAASRALARGRPRARALHRLGRQVGRAEGEARLHGAGREPGLPVRPGVGRGALALVPLRGHRRGVRPRLGRIGALRPELFQQLNLQLLIVTPLQKIHVIEPYVASVGFVHNEDGQALACCAT